MKTILRLCFVFLLSMVPASAQEKPAFRLHEVLPPGKVMLDPVIVAYSPRANELMERMQQAVATNRDWFLEQVKLAPPGQPIPYHPNLGLTEAEYEEMLTESKKPRLARTGQKIQVTIVKEGTIFSFLSEESDSPFENLRIDASTTDLSAPVGNLGPAKWESSDGANTALGPWEGYTWHFEKAEAEANTARLFTLQILRLKRSGKMFLSVKDHDIVARLPRKSVELAAIYDLPLPTSAGTISPTPGSDSLNAAPAPIRYDELKLRGVLGFPKKPVALINNESFGVGERGKVKLGDGVAKILCKEIRADSVTVVVDDKEEIELKLSSKGP
jgi:hypothetical protein